MAERAETIQTPSTPNTQSFFRKELCDLSELRVENRLSVLRFVRMLGAAVEERAETI